MMEWFRDMYRNSHPKVFCKKVVLRNFTKFTGKHLCQSLFLTALVAASVCNVVKIKNNKCSSRF